MKLNGNYFVVTFFSEKPSKKNYTDPIENFKVIAMIAVRLFLYTEIKMKTIQRKPMKLQVEMFLFFCVRRRAPISYIDESTCVYPIPTIFCGSVINFFM